LRLGCGWLRNLPILSSLIILNLMFNPDQQMALNLYNKEVAMSINDLNITRTEDWKKEQTEVS